jgi:hypothetical protein
MENRDVYRIFQTYYYSKKSEVNQINHAVIATLYSDETKDL